MRLARGRSARGRPRGRPVKAAPTQGGEGGQAHQVGHEVGDEGEVARVHADAVRPKHRRHLAHNGGAARLHAICGQHGCRAVGAQPVAVDEVLRATKAGAGAVAVSAQQSAGEAAAHGGGHAGRARAAACGHQAMQQRGQEGRAWWGHTPRMLMPSVCRV